MGILEMLFGGGQQGGQPPQQGAPPPYLPGRTRMPFDIPPPDQGGGDNTMNLLQEVMRRRQGGSQQMAMAPNNPAGGPMPYWNDVPEPQGPTDQPAPPGWLPPPQQASFRPDSPAPSPPYGAVMPPGPEGWYQGPSDPPLDQRIMEWLKTLPKPAPRPERPPGPPSMPMAPGEDVIPGSPGRPWPQMGEPGHLESRRRMRPDMFQGGPLPSPYEEMEPPQPQSPSVNPDQFRDPGWAEPRTPGWKYLRPPEGQMVEGSQPQPLWPVKRRTA